MSNLKHNTCILRVVAVSNQNPLMLGFFLTKMCIFREYEKLAQMVGLRNIDMFQMIVTWQLFVKNYMKMQFYFFYG